MKLIVKIVAFLLLVPALATAQSLLSPSYKNVTVTGTLNASITASQVNSGQLDNARIPTSLQPGTSLGPSIQNSVSTYATTTNGSPTITVSSAAGLATGQQVFTYPLVPKPTFIKTISGTTITLSANATVTNSTPVLMQFGQDRWSATSSFLTNTIGAQNVFIGAAAQGNTSGWLNQYFPGSDYRTLSNFISVPTAGYGGVAGIFASRSSQNNGSCCGAFTLDITTVVDGYNSSNKDSWGLYNEGNLIGPTVGYHINEESSVYSEWAYVPTDPYSYNQLGAARNLRLDCGKGSGSPQACAAALEIVQNGAMYGKGIVFGSDAIGTLPDGTKPAIVMATNQGIHWFTANNTPGWYVASTKTSGAEAGIVLSNTAATIGADVAANGHIYQAAGAPALSSCGSGTPTVNSGATDTHGTVTEGTSATGCTITFVKAYAFAPTCVVSSPSGSSFTSYSTSTTALTISNASAAGNKYSYICMGG